MNVCIYVYTCVVCAYVCMYVIMYVCNLYIYIYISLWLYRLINPELNTLLVQLFRGEHRMLLLMKYVSSSQILESAKLVGVVFTCYPLREA